ncbi:MAG: DUF3592 domain-containing protein [Tepidisphaeraceae bacterium]
MTTAATTARARRRDGAGCLTFLALILFLSAGLLIFLEFFLDPINKVIQSLRWDRVPCTILVSRVEEALLPKKPPGSDARSPEGSPAGSAYKANVQFRYGYGGKFYISNRIYFIKPDPNTRLDILAIVNRYQVGAFHRCYVDPADPTFAVLERGFKPVLLIAIVPVLMIAVGLGGLVSISLARLRPTKPRRVNVRYRPTLRPTGQRQPIVLRPVRRGAGLATAFLLAVGWNFTVFVLVREVARDWAEGFPGCHGLILTAFTAVLVVIGACLAIAPVILLFRRLSPRPVVTLESIKVQAGREIELSWRLRGWRRQLRRLTIILEGREEATYAREEGLCTDREVFHSNCIFQGNRRASRAGTVRLTVPARLPPTLVAQHNAVFWVVRFHMRLRQWPDIEDELELTVLPQEGSSADGTRTGGIQDMQTAPDSASGGTGGTSSATGDGPAEGRPGHG